MTPADRLALLKERAALLQQHLASKPKKQAPRAGAGRPPGGWSLRKKRADAAGLTAMGMLYRERRAAGKCPYCEGTMPCRPCRLVRNKAEAEKKGGGPLQKRTCSTCGELDHNRQTCPNPRDPVAHRVRPAPRPAPLGPVGEMPTPAQYETLLAICEITTKKGVPPSIRDLTAHHGLRGVCAVQDRLRYLAAKGLVTWDIWRARTLRPTEAGLALLLRAGQGDRQAAKEGSADTDGQCDVGVGLQAGDAGRGGEGASQ
jgi:hypothetical protein